MRILVLGGTRFVGRHLVEAALARGFELTLFNRGSHPEVFPGLRQLVGDRGGDLSALAEGSWEAVIDVSGYVPRAVRATAELLRGRVAFYAFISTISVYAEQSRPYLREDDALATLADEATEEVTGESYGGLKALCEGVVREVFPEAHLIVRPGVVVGPHDPTDRFTYWPVRVAAGGEVLAPEGPDLPIQFIDARDLAHWTLGMIAARQGGTYNAVTPAGAVHLGDLLETAREVSGSNASPSWVDGGFLLAQGVKPFVDLPLWLPSENGAFARVSSDKAQGKGLTFRPLEETVRDTLAWSRGRTQGADLRTGLSRERERELLEAWRGR